MNYDMNIKVWEPYFSKLSDETKKQLVIKVLEMAKRVVPEAEAALPYGVPGLKYKTKNLVAVAAHATHLGIYPFSPEVVEKVMPLLKTAKASKGTIKFGYDSLPTEKEVADIVLLSKERLERDTI